MIRILFLILTLFFPSLCYAFDDRDADGLQSHNFSNLTSFHTPAPEESEEIEETEGVPEFGKFIAIGLGMLVCCGGVFALTNHFRSRQDKRREADSSYNLAEQYIRGLDEERRTRPYTSNTLDASAADNTSICISISSEIPSKLKKEDEVEVVSSQPPSPLAGDCREVDCTLEAIRDGERSPKLSARRENRYSRASITSSAFSDYLSRPQRGRGRGISALPAFDEADIAPDRDGANSRSSFSSGSNPYSPPRHAHRLFSPPTEFVKSPLLFERRLSNASSFNTNTSFGERKGGGGGGGRCVRCNRNQASTVCSGCGPLCAKCGNRRARRCEKDDHIRSALIEEGHSGSFNLGYSGDRRSPCESCALSGMSVDSASSCSKCGTLFCRDCAQDAYLNTKSSQAGATWAHCAHAFSYRI